MSLLQRILDRDGDGRAEAVGTTPDDLNRDLRLARRLRVNIALAGFALTSDDLRNAEDYISNLVPSLREFDAVIIDDNRRMLYIWLFDANRTRARQVLSRLEESVSEGLVRLLKDSLIGCAEFPVDGLTFDALLHSVTPSPESLPAASNQQFSSRYRRRVDTHGSCNVPAPSTESGSHGF